jgi:hypothetical protein
MIGISLEAFGASHRENGNQAQRNYIQLKSSTTVDLAAPYGRNTLHAV